MRLFPLVLLTALFLSPARAALLIEPVVGLNLGTKLDVDSGDDTDSYGSGGGIGYGGRLGYQQLGFQFGLDYLASSVDLGEDDVDKNLSMSEWGAFAGFEFPVLVRVYAGYIFSATAETTIDDEKYEFSNGSGMKAGIGFTGIPFLDINLEYRRGTFDEAKVAGDEDEDVSADYQSVLLSLSLPLTF